MLVFDTQVVHFPAAPVVCFSPALDNRSSTALQLHELARP